MTRARKALTLVVSAAVTAAGLAVTPLTFAAEAPGNACPDVEIIGARGTTERPGLGSMLTPLARQITRTVSQTVRTTALDYPASWDYQNSLRTGVTNLGASVQRTAAACAGTRFVLMGYSQGAHVIGDALVGGAGGAATVPAALAPRVAAVLLLGDPTFTAGETFNVTDGTGSGVQARGTGRLAPFAGRIQSYCNRTDRYCDGGNSSLAHINYRKFQSAATTFTVARLR